MTTVAKGLSSVSGVLIILINHIESVCELIINVCSDLTVYAIHKKSLFSVEGFGTLSVFNICNNSSKNFFLHHVWNDFLNIVQSV